MPLHIWLSFYAKRTHNHMVLPPTARDEASMAIGHGAKSVLFWLRNEEAVHIPASRTFELIYNANYKQAQLHLEETSFYIWQNSTDYPPLLSLELNCFCSKIH